MQVRAATPEDAAAIQAIYAHHVLHGLGTFEEAPPDVEEIVARMAAIAADGLPWLVVEDGGAIAAYAYASQFRPRTAYRFTVEDSVYVAPAAVGRGCGRIALAALISACEALGKRRMAAVIGDSGNAASIGLHRALGFEPAGVLHDIGFKHGRWVDVVLMERVLDPPVAKA
ncbi:MAG: N-acetyltransferase family protein [Caulobacteraceae bacterium]